MRYIEYKSKLKENPKKWLITGIAGFIGSNLLEELLSLDQYVIGIDNFSTGISSNLESVEESVSKKQWKRFKMVNGDITNFVQCQEICSDVNYILHQAALGSVPRSISDPINSNHSNVTGFLNILTAAKENNIDGFVYAASSSTYGDHEALPKVEDQIGSPLSPYAVTKLVNELYADVYARSYGFKTIGLRYFNVFGRRQNPDGAYAAVIPRFIDNMIKGEDIYINGDGETSRDFCYIDNVIQMNILAALADDKDKNNIFNVALGERTSLNQLFERIKDSLTHHGIKDINQPIYRDFREGDVRHAQADISKAKRILGYEPTHKFNEGIKEAIEWYILKHQI